MAGRTGGLLGVALLSPVAILGGVPGVLIWHLWWVLVVVTGLALASRRRPLGLGISAGAALLLLVVTVVAATTA